MEVTLKYKNKKELIKAKKRNAKIYPIYKMFSWDLLFFYSIQYLFFTMTKGISPADILKVDAFYPIFIILMQVPAVVCGEFFGRKKSIIMGNALIALHIIILIVLPGIWGMFIANIIWAFGYSLKSMQETNILYDSTATKNGEGIYPKINAKGASGYYILDGVASLIAGYLFVINGYLPMYICLGFTILATITACGFKDIYENKLESNIISKNIKEYKEDFKYSLKAMIKSKRLRALIIFMAVFNAAISIMGTYRGNILTSLNVEPEVFSIIGAVMTLIGGLATTLQDKIHKRFRNKTLKILSMTYITSIIGIGLLLLINNNNILPIVLILLTVRQITLCIYYTLSERYLKNFSTPKTRTRISFAYEFVTNIGEAILLFVSGVVLESTGIQVATIWMGLLLFMLFVITLDYMRTRVGLKPQEYSKEDIELD